MPSLNPVLKNLINLASAFDNYEPADRPSTRDIAAAQRDAECVLPTVNRLDGWTIQPRPERRSD